MSRAELRRAKKAAQKNDPVLNIRKSELDRMLSEARKSGSYDGLDIIAALLLGMSVKVAKEKYGFGKKRLMDLANALTDEYQDFADGNITVDRYKQLVLECTGVEIL